MGGLAKTAAIDRHRFCDWGVQVTDISTFTDDKKRAEVDAWLYETCTQCLQHIIDITVKFYPVVQPLMGRVLDLLLNFIRCATQFEFMPCLVSKQALVTGLTCYRLQF